MSDYIITASSTADLSKEYADRHHLSILPYSFIINDKEYKDDFGHSMPSKTFYEKVRNGARPSTSMVNQDSYRELFTEALEAKKDILHIEFSSGLSGSFQNARTVVEELNEKYDNKIYLVDSLCASMGYGLLVDYAVKMKDSGRPVKEVYDWVENNKIKIIHWFTVDDLNHLKRGGRISTASAFIGTMLSIKPVLDVDIEGHLIPIQKVRGRKKAILELLNKMKMDIERPDGQTVFISHGDAEEEALFLKSKIMEAFPKITDITVGDIGPVIGAHSGPGTIALFYYGKERY